MSFRYAIISGFLGQTKDRFKFYQEPRDLETKIELASKIKGADGLELVYPYDFKDVQETRKLLKKYKLAVSSINVDIKGESYWNKRALSAESGATRKKAIAYLARGAEISHELGVNLVTVCPLQDGYDYHFEIDYSKSWKYFINGIREVASAFSNVRISLEYKGAEPLTQYLLGNLHSALFTCLKTNLPNVGVTLDTGHALFAKENPAESLMLLHGEDRLFHVHINDNDGNWDWDLISGGRNLLANLEFIYYLQKIGYKGWIALDVTSKNRSPVEILGTSIALYQMMEKKVAKFDKKLITKNIQQDSPHETLRYIYKNLFKEG